MFISSIAIRRPLFTAMIILAMIVFGIVSLMGLGVDLFPRVDFPVISIVTQLRGADPETVETRVSDPLEAAVNTLSGIKTLRSTSAEGYSLVVVEFELEKNIDVAFQEVQARINTVRSQLPVDVEDPVVEKIDLDASPIMTVIVSGNLDGRQLHYLADKDIKERLQRVRNVGSVKLVGGRERKLWLWLDPALLRQHGLSCQDVAAALRSQHVEMPGGRVETDTLELVTRTKAEFHSAAELEELVLAQKDGLTIRLKDVGKAEDGLEELRSYSQRDDKQGIALQVRRQSGTNTVEVAHQVKAEIEKLRQELGPRGVRLDVAVDFSVYIEKSVNEVKHHLVLGGGLAVLTVLIFLLNFRSTFISSLVLPTSILATFMMMAAMNFTLNFMTLMALTLAIGLLIDDAIVVQENIMRHVEAGKPAHFAAEFATHEIGLAVLATSLSVVAVFLPTAYTKGIVGRFFFPFGLTISCAVLISMFVSFTLDPMLSSRLLKKHQRHNVVFRTMERAFKGLESLYGHVLGWCLRHRAVVVVLAVVLFGASLSLGKFIRTEFRPQEDRGEFTIAVKAPLGSSLGRTRETMEEIRRRLVGLPEVAYTFYTIGGDELSKVNEGAMYVAMTPKLQRIQKRQRSQQQLFAEVRDRLKDLPDARTAVHEVEAIGGNSGWKSAQIQFELCGPDLNLLEKLAGQYMAKLRQAHGYKDIDSTHEPGRPETTILVNRDRAAELGVSPAAIADTIRTAIGGLDVSKLRDGADRYDIAVRFLESGRNDPQRILDLEVPSATGERIELRNVANIVPSAIPVEINRYNRQREITLLANLQSDKVLGDATKEIDVFTKQIGLPVGYTGSWTGQAEVMDESFRNLRFTMILSVLVTYMVLAAQFESLVHPFTIMLSLPLAFVGSLGSLLIFGQTMSIFTMMAFIFLLGLVTKNAILLIDYTNTLRNRDGLEKLDALRRAGPVRLRPILMTTVAMIFGMLPSAIGMGSGSESRQPMAIAIIGGLVSSTMLTLLIVPVVYSLLDPLSEWMKRHVLRSHIIGKGQSAPADDAAKF